MSTKVTVVKNVLDANDRLAAENRTLFAEKKVFVVNLMSSPGAGKTTLLERTIRELRGNWKIGVIEGDIQDTYDADRIAALDIPVVQINTGGACHIDGNMVREALPGLNMDDHGSPFCRKCRKPGLSRGVRYRRTDEDHDPEHAGGGR